jgi:uncharacterized protein (DUF433 family)
MSISAARSAGFIPFEMWWVFERLRYFGIAIVFRSKNRGASELGSQVIMTPRGVPYGLLLAIEKLFSTMRSAADRLRDRRGDQIETIVRNRYVVHNAWVVGGTRIPTLAIWNFHKAGYSDAAIVGEYPRLTRKDVRAAIEFEVNRQQAA